jgi:hypothetical protein
MRRIKGFALLQALFFMMFIMAAISITMMMSAQRNHGVAGQRMAVDVFPALTSFLHNYQSQLTDKGVTGTFYAKDYFINYPLSPDYIKKLNDEGISDPSKDNNLTITVTQS